MIVKTDGWFCGLLMSTPMWVPIHIEFIRVGNDPDTMYNWTRITLRRG